jgi:carbon storage regulator
MPVSQGKGGRRLMEESDMLVLSRKFGQKFRIGDDVTITIVKLDRNAVRIGVEAPHSVGIYREELSEADREKLARAQAA